MSDIGFNDNLEVSGRTFHFQTASNVKKGSVRCEIFEKGRVISTSVVDFERRQTNKTHSIEKRLKDIVESMHREMMAEIELLFLIAEKVKKLRHAPSNTKMGIMFLQNNLIDDALEQFEMAIKNDPNYLEAYNSMALTYLQIGEQKKAIKIIAQAMEKDNRFADMHNNYGLALMMDMQFRKALNEFREALKINGRYSEAQYNLAVLFFKSTMHDKTDDYLPPPSIRIQRGIEQLEKLRAVGLKRFDDIYEKVRKNLDNEDIETAVKLLEENRERIFPRDSLSLIGTSFYLKFMYGGKGLDNEIIRKYERRLETALEMHGDYADIWNNLGIIHLIQCRNLFLQALSEFKRALEINPGFEKARKNKKLVENDGKEFLILLRAILK